MKTMPRRTRRSVPTTGWPPPIAAFTIVNSLTKGPNGGEPVIAKKPARKRLPEIGRREMAPEISSVLLLP
jgi:hypothetical protein